MNYFEGKDSIKNPDAIFPAIEEMRIPLQYLANMLTAGDVEPVKGALQKMAMMRYEDRFVIPSSHRENCRKWKRRTGCFKERGQMLAKLKVLIFMGDNRLIDFCPMLYIQRALT